MGLLRELRLGADAWGTGKLLPTGVCAVAAAEFYFGGAVAIEQVTRDYPKVWYAWAALGECFVQLHDLPQAEASLRNAAELSKEPRVIQEWQELRAAMELANQAGPN